MATPAQIEANRRNAQRSTGPRTADGKATASRNALKHGLRAVDAVLPIVEDPHQFEAFSQSIVAELQPVGVQQELLAERIVHLQWKLRRLPKIEAETVRDLIVSNGKVIGVGVLAHDLRSTRNGKSTSALMTLQMYEQRLQRMLAAAMREFRQLKKETAAAEKTSRDQSESAERSQFAPRLRLHEELALTASENDSPFIRHITAGPGGPPPGKRSADEEGSIG